MPESDTQRPSTWQSLKAAASVWRIGAVTLLSLSSGLPLGLVWIAIPPWLTKAGIPIAEVGLLTLTQAPWTFKFLWAPLMDRFSLPWLGRKRGWILLTQLALIAGTALLAAAATDPRFWLTFGLATSIAFLSASQDIAYDGYAVEVLRKDELELASGGRIALYRVGMFIAGAVTITAAGWLGWPLVFAILAALYLPLLAITVTAPEPEVEPDRPQTLSKAVWQPLVTFFRTDHALVIAAFIFLYKISDNLAGALVRPFLVQTGFNDIDVGVATGTVGLIAAIGGAALGAVICKGMGLGRALWFFGFLQALTNLGYVAVAAVGVNRPLMYAAMAFETGTSNMGSAAFMVLLLRLTDKRFSATQFALLTGVMALGRTVAGPPAGFLVELVGWKTFFLLTIPLAVPGLVLLQRFVPFGAREPVLLEESVGERTPVTLRALVARGALAALAAAAIGALTAATFAGLKGTAADPVVAFDLLGRLRDLAAPTDPPDWIRLAGIAVFAVVTGTAVAALTAARHGMRAAATDRDGAS